MNIACKLIFIITMGVALLFGFLHNFITGYNFERLHIFLFNLCTGGSLILFYSNKFKKYDFIIFLFFISSFVYAILSFFHYYKPAIFIALGLFLIVECIRRKNFGSIKRFFDIKNNVSNKFRHASLLCLSIGLIISICAIINEYTNLYYIKRLSLDSFFLGFSFPISLITFSVIFDLIKEKIESKKILGEICFWVINLGVITFFIFIITEQIIFELIISLILGFCVFFVFYVFIKNCGHIQQKYFLTSGMFFLLMTAVTGILYIVVYINSPHNELLLNKIIEYHRLISLYGWNLSGLAVIVRFDDFPIKLDSTYAIALHWLTVAILAPIAMSSRIFTIITLAMYLIYLKLLFFSKSSVKDEQIVNN
jgi:hypothetical protein